MCFVEFGFLKYDYGMETHLKLFQDTKNKFTVHSYAPVTLIFSLEKWVFLIFGDFGLKNAKNPKNAHFSSEKRGVKNASKCIINVFFVFRKSLRWLFIP